MSEITVSVDDAVARELAKRDRKIAKLEARVTKLLTEAEQWRRRFEAVEELRNAILNAACLIDDWYPERDG